MFNVQCSMFNVQRVTVPLSTPQSAARPAASRTWRSGSGDLLSPILILHRTLTDSHFSPCQSVPVRCTLFKYQIHYVDLCRLLRLGGPLLQEAADGDGVSEHVGCSLGHRSHKGRMSRTPSCPSSCLIALNVLQNTSSIFIISGSKFFTFHSSLLT